MSELVASVSQINAGVTTTVDTSQVSLSPAHTDACIAGLEGIRTDERCSPTQRAQAQASQFPQDITRLRKQYFSSSDQLLDAGARRGLGRGTAESWLARWVLRWSRTSSRATCNRSRRRDCSGRTSSTSTARS